MLVEIKRITKCGSYTKWETEVLGRNIEVRQKDDGKPQLTDLALTFALDDNGLSADEFTNPVVNAGTGDKFIISSIPLSTTMNFCNRKLNANLTCLVGSAHRHLDAYVLTSRYGKNRLEGLLSKINERSERRFDRVKKGGNCNRSPKTTRLERQLMSIINFSLKAKPL
ncbi:hypothetical protein [Vibrio sp. R78045]|uniref:hypothetical protein n=1 Tax=Vibrio sp. R78045 TaxID=3093868 RepID=UPI0036F42C77